jgi:4-amino-4-deoxy-L-arabinose transferase-like glycosyltransferase
MNARFVASTGWLLAAILSVALILRLGAGVWWQERLPAGKTFAFGDSEGYWVLARTIARGEPYEYGADKSKIFRTPGYPAVLAPLFWLAADPPVLWGRAVSAVLGTAAVGGVAGIAWLLFDQRTALMAAGLAAVYPEAIAAGVFVLSEAPFTPLMMLHLILWTLAWRAESFSNTAGWSFAGGVAAGLATLMRPSWLLFIPFAAVMGLTFYRDRQKQIAIVAIMLLGLCLTMTPWWVRNYRIAGRFVPTSLQVGASLYDGLSPIATGASDMRFVPEFLAEQQAADAAGDGKVSGLLEDRLDRRLRDVSINWARQNPGQVLRLAAIKSGRMWSPLPNAGEFQSRTPRLILAASYSPVMLLAFVGAWQFARRDWPYLLCLLPAVYFTCLHVVFVSSIRYRQPAMLPLIVLAAAVVARLVTAEPTMEDHREAHASRSPDL